MARSQGVFMFRVLVFVSLVAVLFQLGVSVESAPVTAAHAEPSGAAE